MDLMPLHALGHKVMPDPTPWANCRKNIDIDGNCGGLHGGSGNEGAHALSPVASRIFIRPICRDGKDTSHMQLRTEEGYRDIHCTTCKHHRPCGWWKCLCKNCWNQCSIHTTDPKVPGDRKRNKNEQQWDRELDGTRPIPKMCNQQEQGDETPTIKATTVKVIQRTHDKRREHKRPMQAVDGNIERCCMMFGEKQSRKVMLHSNRHPKFVQKVAAINQGSKGDRTNPSEQPTDNDDDEGNERPLQDKSDHGNLSTAETRTEGGAERKECVSECLKPDGATTNKVLFLCWERRWHRRSGMCECMSQTGWS